MSYNFQQNCRKFSLFLSVMLYLQATFCQYSFKNADNWLKNKTNELGGRAVLVVLKNGNIIYEKSVNDLSRKQKVIGKFIARRQGKDTNEMLQDYTITTRGAIASCSKWLSADAA